jgi:hypothetical protein
MCLQNAPSKSSPELFPSVAVSHSQLYRSRFNPPRFLFANSKKWIPMPPQLVIADDCGFLGNRLIVCGHLIAFCEEFGFDLWMYNLRDAAPNYLELRDNKHCRFPAARRSKLELLPVPMMRNLSHVAGRCLRKLRLRVPLTQQITAMEPDPSTLTDTILDDDFARKVRNKYCTFLFGWRFRNYDLFHVHQETIRRWNRLVPALEENLGQFLRTVREPRVTLVGVHITQILRFDLRQDTWIQ